MVKNKRRNSKAAANKNMPVATKVNRNIAGLTMILFYPRNQDYKLIPNDIALFFFHFKEKQYSAGRVTYLG